ncbi:MAG: hypothetical protein C4527_11645 [Candidatus Omnitrophota bacterium]|nr:MAG: hypothetical protein C4527_11645 [Candidatus Omnitrophota bacterium]
MNVILALVIKDLKRDMKRPWSIIIMTIIPIMISGMIAMIFGRDSNSQTVPTIHVALLDRDEDLLSGYLRMIPSQGDAAEQLQIHHVKTVDEGIRLLEKRKASAFLVLPENMTVNLLNGVTAAIEIYENPAEQILPQVVRQGVSLLAEGLSGAAEILQEPLRNMRDLIEAEKFPTEEAVVNIATQSIRRLDSLQTYLFPPIVEFQTLTAEEYLSGATTKLTENHTNE